MKKNKILLIVALVLIFLVLVVVVLKLTLGGRATKVEDELKVGTENVTTLDAVAGDKAVAEITNSEDESGTVQEIAYEDGVISIDEINEYIRKLMQEDGFVVTKEAEIGEDGSQTYQLGKQTEKENEVILVDFYFEVGGSVRVSYRVANGPLKAVG